jgi:hypothetical protein
MRITTSKSSLIDTQSDSTMNWCLSELERQKIIADNRALLDSLGFEAGGAAKLNLAKPRPTAKPAAANSKKRKAAPVKTEEGPRRRSGRIAGIDASVEVLQERAIEEEKEREVLRVINRKTREQVMGLSSMLEDAEEGDKDTLVSGIASGPSSW